MTARYRCFECGSKLGDARTVRIHFYKRHRMLIIDRLGLIETFTTRKEAITP